MSLMSARVLVLKDEYTDEELELNKFLVNNCMDLVIIDERCERSRAIVPTEIEWDRFYKKYTVKPKDEEQLVPEKINVEVIEDDVRQTDKGNE